MVLKFDAKLLICPLSATSIASIVEKRYFRKIKIATNQPVKGEKPKYSVF
jgi:hypothetical protein